MASTMVATVAQPSLSIKASAAGPLCPSCGADVPEDLAAAYARIAELEGEVRSLNDKAATAINRWAEHEVELTRLRSATSPHQHQHHQHHQHHHPRPSPTTRSSPSSYLQQSTERISALLYSRKPSTATLRTGAPLAALQTASAGVALGAADSAAAAAAIATTPSTPTYMAEDLLEALNREQGLRREAEGRLSATSREMEELSAALFEQANEMVADERRARARLEERVGELERRDAEKKKRLDRLESAMARIERVRDLLRE